MTVQIDDIRKQVLALAEKERRQLMRDIEASLQPTEIESAWYEEAQRRAEAFDRGEIEAVPAETALKKTFRRLSAK